MHSRRYTTRSALRRAAPVGLVALLWAAAAGLSQDRKGPTPEDRFFSEIEGAFRASDANRVARLLSQRDKTIIVVPELYSATGAFGASQARFILDKIFSSHETTAFRIETKDRPARGERAYQVACRWSLKPRDGSAAVHLVLFLRLRLEEERWVISELRSAQTGSTRRE